MAYTLEEIAQRLSGLLQGPQDLEIGGVASLARAREGEVAFYLHPAYRQDLALTRASAVIIAKGEEEATSLPKVVVENPQVAMARLLEMFALEEPKQAGVDPGAFVAGDAVIHESAYVGPGAVVERWVQVKAGASIEAGVYLGQGVVVGEDARIGPRAVLYPGVTLGKRVVIHAGAVLGARGFGLARDKGAWMPIPQLGGVKVGDDAEIGANTTIDRGTLEDTVIEEGVKIDNLVQIGHNVRIGAHSAIAACVGIAGSTIIGCGCVIGGAAMITGHVHIPDGTEISGGTSVMGPLRAPGRYTSVVPALLHRQWKKNAAHWPKLAEMAKRLAAVEAWIKKSQSP